MNDHLATIIHNDKTAQWRREANDSQLIATSRRADDESDSDTVMAKLGRAALVVTVSLAVLFVFFQYVS